MMKESAKKKEDNLTLDVLEPKLISKMPKNTKNKHTRLPNPSRILTVAKP
jgi:CRISPR/Cas system CMR subunit Cmr6 (Cas7 group RAMP superfamily)